ncbi:hypothetical protein Tco_0899921 [Tanacetum coccineum]
MPQQTPTLSGVPRYERVGTLTILSNRHDRQYESYLGILSIESSHRQPQGMYGIVNRIPPPSSIDSESAMYLGDLAVDEASSA